MGRVTVVSGGEADRKMTEVAVTSREKAVVNSLTRGHVTRSLWCKVETLTESMYMKLEVPVVQLSLPILHTPTVLKG